MEVIEAQSARTWGLTITSITSMSARRRTADHPDLNTMQAMPTRGRPAARWRIFARMVTPLNDYVPRLRSHLHEASCYPAAVAPAADATCAHCQRESPCPT